ncbi:DUF2167 domain-containing protein [Paenibacillus tuaregi]|uniref:DUF2167 domain-containing protein n=1 Tax=Paenibacillus tuaregi TaxID=1816681 RepID=UPI000AE6D79C|nr:DUF2167 domain-containing protein [Paenibacillus tuaregi]
MRRRRGLTQRLGAAVIAVMLLGMSAPYQVSAEETQSTSSDLNYIEGKGQMVNIGSNLAELKLERGFYFLNAEDTKRAVRESGGIVDGTEAGMLIPEDDSWTLLFDYEKTGHIPDSEKNEIDADDLLQSYRDGVAEQNKKRSAEKQLFVDKWETPPKYNETLHSLTWTIQGHDAKNEPIINHNIRLLTREGTISAVIVTDPNMLSGAKSVVESQIIPALKLRPGSKYEDYDKSTDKTAEYGLAGLVLGGAGVYVAKKTGLLALLLVFLKKGWILIVAALAFVWNLIRGKRKKKNEMQQEPPQQDPPSENPPDHGMTIR